MRTYVNMEPQGGWEPKYEESDFTYGAKTTPSLPPTTSTNNVTFDLPQWAETPDFLGMETPDLMGLDDNSDLWNSMFVTSSGSSPYISQQVQASTDVIIDLDNKDILDIQPEDMLVPLSQLQPKAPTTIVMQAIQQPPPLPTQPKPAEPQKIVISVRKVSLPNAKESSPAPYIIISPPKQNVGNQRVVPQYSSKRSVVAPIAAADSSAVLNQVMSSKSNMFKVSPHHVVPQNAYNQIPNKQQQNNSDQLLDELMQMIGSDVKPEDLQLEELTETLESFDNDAFVNGTYSETKSNYYASESGYCLALPSPEHSVGSLSPCQSEKGFLSPPQSIAFVNMSSMSPQPCSTVDTLDILSPPASVRSELNVMSPAPSVSEMSVGSPVSPSHDTSYDADSQDSSYNINQDELHSYSRSTNKSKSSRRSYGARSTPYPETRRERKKEQNKQAALRYRQKKKQEDDDVLSLLRNEEEKQKELKEKYANIKQEMTYLKKIMREVFIAKGVLSEESFKK